MKQIFKWVTAAILCSAVGAQAAEPLPGQHVPAIEQGERAVVLAEAALGKDHLEVAKALNHLANLYRHQGWYTRAEPLLQRALAIQEAALGQNHPLVANTLNNLAILSARRLLFARAEALLQRALAIQEEALGKSHPDVGQSLLNLASVSMAQGRHAQAEPLLRRSLAIQEATLGENHPELAPLLTSLAEIQLAWHGLAGALPLFTRAFSIAEHQLRQEALSLSDNRLVTSLQRLRMDENRLYELLHEHPDNEDVRRLALSAMLLLKGRSAGEMADTSRTIHRSLGERDRSTFERLRELRGQFAALSLHGPGEQPLADYHQRLSGLAAEGDALEAELARRSAPLRALTTLPPPAEVVHRVAQALPRDGALVELIIHVDSSPAGKAGAPGTKRPFQLRYLAVVLLPNAETRALDLGPTEPIDRAAMELREALANRDAGYLVPARALYQLAFQPLLPLLGKAQRLFLSPDGQLGLVPFAALHDGQQFLIDSYDFTYLTSGRDLLSRFQPAASTGSVAVLADPDFHTARAHLGQAPLAPLPGTRLEAQAIQRLIPNAQLFLGPEANKQRLLQLPTPAILHLATHGFFLDDSPAPEDSRGLGTFGGMAESAPVRRVHHPLLRSGLVLSGAEPQASESGTLPAASSLVTALELAGMDLWGTQLVVLSACDTGRGDVLLGQGVYGLRRAFVTAGAETVVTSLWKVRDDSTHLLMESYYRNLLAGQGRASALRSAMRSMRETHPHPHDWAPFIVLGRDAPLRPLGKF
jgi:CHAT domain-containing protein